MPQQAVTVELTDAELSTLGKLFGVDPKPAAAPALGALVSGFAEAAFREYMLAMSGERAPTGVRDLRELRLQLLAKHLPSGLPSDRQVAELFHLTMSQARTLIAGTRARYPEDFRDLLVAAAKSALVNATAVDKNTVRITASDSLAAYLRDELSDSVAPPPLKKPDFSSRYDLNRATVGDLCERIGLDPKAVKALP